MCATLASDPPLLQLETATTHVYLRVLLKLQAASPATEVPPTEGALCELMRQTMEAFVGVAGGGEQAAAAVGGGDAEGAWTSPTPIVHVCESQDAMGSRLAAIGANAGLSWVLDVAQRAKSARALGITLW